MTGILASSLIERIMTADPAALAAGAGSDHAGVASIMTGIVLCGFGVTRLGRAIRYVPYPVVGGFLGATGCLILLGGIRVITGIALQWRRSTNSQPADAVRTGGGLRHGVDAVSDLASLTNVRSDCRPILIGGVIAAHIVFWLAGFSPAEAQAAGWTFQAAAAASASCCHGAAATSAAIPGMRCRISAAI